MALSGGKEAAQFVEQIKSAINLVRRETRLELADLDSPVGGMMVIPWDRSTAINHAVRVVDLGWGLPCPL